MTPVVYIVRGGTDDLLESVERILKRTQIAFEARKDNDGVRIELIEPIESESVFVVRILTRAGWEVEVLQR